MPTSTLAALLGGLVLLTLGGEGLVRGSSRLAAAAGMSPLVIGLTLVAFGTSAPELATSLAGARAGSADIAFGNVLGSNVFNVLIVLGLSALIAPLAVQSKLVRVDVPLMVGASALVPLVALDGRVGRLEGVALFSLLIVYVTVTVRASRAESRAVRAEYAEAFGTPARGGRALALNVVLILGGLAALVLGARWLVAGAVEVARALDVSELVIGLTVVAAGTSLPELATSVLATVRGERDIAVGNVVGSNLFNVLCVLGGAAAASPEGVAVSPRALRVDVPVMLAAALVCVPICRTGHRISRLEGGLLFASYVVYTAWLVWAARA